MADKLLRHIPTGVIWVSQPAFEVRADFEPYEEAPVVEEPTPAPVSRKRRAAAPVEETAPVEEPTADAAPIEAQTADEIAEAISADASRGA